VQLRGAGPGPGPGRADDPGPGDLHDRLRASRPPPKGRGGEQHTGACRRRGVTAMESALLLERASTAAGWVDGLFLFQMLVTFVVTALVFFLVVYLAVKYRRGSRADRSRPLLHNTPLELTLIAVLLVLAMIMFVWGAYGYLKLFDPPG